MTDQNQATEQVAETKGEEKQFQGQQTPKLSVEQMTMQIGSMLDPAFPIVLAHQGQLGVVGGLSKREYYAALAMQGICSSRDEAGELLHHGYDWIAKESVTVADALIKALSVSSAKAAPSSEQQEQVPVPVEEVAVPAQDAVEP